MTPPVFAFRLTCLLLGGVACVTRGGPSTLRPSAVNRGDDVTLPCLYEDTLTTTLFWYRQTLGQTPKLMSHFYKHDEKGSFVGEFKNNSRLGLDTSAGRNHLKISNAQFSDSAIYYCIRSYLNVFVFGESFFLSVNGAGRRIQMSVNQSQSIHPGGSMTLNCVVHTGTCDQPARVHWFRKSGANPGMIYTHGGGSGQCQDNATAQTHTCVYDLPMEVPSQSHAGTYYCAVASCGQILFGKGITLYEKNPPVLVYVLSGALGLTAIMTVFLAYTTYTLRKTLTRQCTGPQTEPLAASAPNAEDEESLHYAALSERTVSRLRRQKDVSTECVYSSVKH